MTKKNKIIENSNEYLFEVKAQNFEINLKNFININEIINIPEHSIYLEYISKLYFLKF